VANALRVHVFGGLQELLHYHSNSRILEPGGEMFLRSQVMGVCHVCITRIHEVEQVDVACVAQHSV
jgi:hypothetical protein